MSPSYAQLLASLTTSVSTKGKKRSFFTENVDDKFPFTFIFIHLDVKKMISEEDISATGRKTIATQFVLLEIKEYR